MGSWNRLTAETREERRGGSLKRSEGISQGTYMKDPWTWATGWGLTMEVGVGLGGGGEGEENWNY